MEEKMTAQAEPEATLSALRADDPRERVTMLQVLMDEAHPEPELLPPVEALLSDEAVTVVGLPFSYGQVRWVAAYTLAWLRRQLGHAGRVRLSGVPVPMSSARLAATRESAGLASSERRYHEGEIDDYRRLVAAGHVPRVDLDLGPEDVALGSRSLRL